jgi:transposase
MESTGVYWKPVYAVLEAEGALEIVVANAQHVKKVPGRKTDVKDAEWIADLLCHGLLRSSFVPPKPIRELRDLTRYRRKLVESQAAERNRLLKLLESANIKLASVATNILGVSGRLMLRALIEGKTTTREMAELAKGKLRNKISELEPALEGKLEEHHRFLLKLQLERLEAAEKDLAILEQRIQEKLEPYVAQLTWLQEIPGVDWTLAAVIIAELGVDMKVSGNVSQLASWAGVCPGNNESAGKRKGSRIPKGNVYLKTALVEAANAAARAKGTCLRDKFFRLKARRWYKRAAVAVAHKILVAIYHMFSDRVSYTERGPTLTKLWLTPAPLNQAVGTAQYIYLGVDLSDGSSGVGPAYGAYSENTSIATVSSGLVTAVAGGTTNIDDVYYRSPIQYNCGAPCQQYGFKLTTQVQVAGCLTTSWSKRTR